MSANLPFIQARIGAIAVVAALAAVAVPGAAGAATVKGTVVAKDAKRGTVATAGRTGAVATLRTTGVRRYRLGQRLVAHATAQPDGTYATSKVKRLRGIAGRARVRATVVQRSSRRLLVSAGSSTFAIRTRTRATASASASRVPQVGDIVVADVRLGGGAATGTHVRAVGETSVLEIEGIFLDITDGVMRLAVERRGLVTVSIPADQQVTATAGDEVEAIVSIADDGSFTLIALKTEDDGGHDHGDDDSTVAPDDNHGGDDGAVGQRDDHGVDFHAEDGTVEVDGVISALTEISLTVVAGPDASITCSAPAGVSLAGFAVDDRVEMECQLKADGSFELRKLKSESHEMKADDLNADDAGGSDDSTTPETPED